MIACCIFGYHCARRWERSTATKGVFVCLFVCLFGAMCRRGGHNNPNICVDWHAVGNPR
jgi:hypothetical protein